MALALTRRDGDGISQLGFDPGVPPSEALGGNELTRWLYHNGGTVWSDDAKQATFNSPAGAKNLEAAWQVTRFLTYQDPACGFLTRDQGRTSPLRRCAEIPEALASPEFKVFVAGAGAGVFVPNTNANSAIAAMLKDAVQTVYDGKASPMSALQDAARTAQVELDKALAPAR